MQLEIGKIYDGKVTGITKFGAFVELEPGTTGMVHISEVANTFVNEIKDHLQEGQAVKVKVLTIGDDGKISLSIKKTVEAPPAPPRRDFKKDGGGFKKEGGFKREGGNFSRPTPIKKAPVAPPKNDVWDSKKSDNLSFEDMLSKFKQNSEEKQCDLKKIIDNKRKSGARRPGGK